MRSTWVISLLLLLVRAGWAEPGRYLCELTPGPPVRARVYRLTAGTRQAVGPEFLYRHRGKMASAADVDGDGCLDLLVLVYKSTRYDPTPGWRPFLFTLKDSRWVPKWLGSRVGRRLLEAALVQTPTGVRLLTLEDFGAHRTGLTLYHWAGFGFWGEWTGKPGPPASGLKVEDGNSGSDEISVSVGGRRLTYVFRDGGYVPVASLFREGKR